MGNRNTDDLRAERRVGCASHRAGRRGMIYQLYQAQADALWATQLFARVGRRHGSPDQLGGAHPPGICAPSWRVLRHAARGRSDAPAAGFRHRVRAYRQSRRASGGGDCRPDALCQPAASSERIPRSCSRRCWWSRPCPGISRPCCAARCRCCCPEHDLFVTDWKNARDIPPRDGTFDLDAFVDHVIRFIEQLGPRSHVIAVCQPAVPVLAAVAAMAETG